jgi:hypothetical protein
VLRSKAGGGVDLVKLYKTLMDIAAGMQYLHSANILHGALLQEGVRTVSLDVWQGLRQSHRHLTSYLAVVGDLKLGNILLKSTATDLRGAHACMLLLLTLLPAAAVSPSLQSCRVVGWLLVASS